MIVHTVLATGDPAKLDEVVAFVREGIQPVVDGLAGSYGLGMWVDRQTGEAAVSTAWRDQAARQVSDERLATLRGEALQRLGAPQPRLQVSEPVLISQRSPAYVGQWTRAVEIRLPVDRLAENLVSFKERTLPALLESPGVTLVVVLANRTTGLSVLSVAYATEADFEASRDRGERLRAESLARLGATVERVTETQLVIAGLQLQIDLPAQGKAVEFPADADI